ncbi:MAG: TetR/AcrR family transcriptional regulator [Tumebacillaceae bacterium]
MESVDKRQAILEAAGKQFGTFGFHETKMEAIAEAAGVAKGTVYLYFKDKNALLFEVARFNMQRYLDRVRQEIEPYERAEDKLRAYARIHTSHFSEMLQFNKLNYQQLMKSGLSEDMTERIKAAHQAQLQLVEGIMLYGIERGEFREMNATHAAIIVTGALHTYIHSIALGSVERKQGDEQADSLIDLLIGGLGC